ncbi:MAG: PAS domain-containing sensor histidine kinase, partial [Halarchaeum sp.]
GGNVSALRVTCRVVDGVVEVAVTDDDPSIGGQDRVVFDATTETAFEHANGIALWTVKWAVEESDGEFRFEGDDSGDRLVVRLPAITA